jgi:hypothetical protein
MMKVKPGLPPHVEVNSPVKEKMKAAVSKCYEARSRALDMSQFHTDPGERMAMYIHKCRAAL